MTVETTYVSAVLRLSTKHGGDVSAKRVALLEAIDSLGSIAAAAQQLGMSYRAAWNVVTELNNLWDEALVEKSPGGVRGGGARLTPAGQELIAAFRLLQTEYLRFTAGLSRHLFDLSRLQRSLGRLSMRTSARNQFQGRVDAIKAGPVNSLVTLAISERDRLIASVTSESVESLGLAPGSKAYAVVKASFVVLMPEDEAVKISACNRLCGTVSGLRHGTVSSEASIALTGGKTLTAVLTEPSAQLPEFEVGRRVCALISASHVILGVN